MADNLATKTRGPRAITRTLDVLRLLSGKQEGLSLAELSTSLSVPKSTLIDTLRGLCDLQYLSCQENRYRLGSATYHFASRIVSHWPAPEMIRAEVRHLAVETRESVGYALADWELGQVFYTEAVNSIQPVRYAMQAGLRAPLYASAAGRVLLAHATDAQATAYFARAHLRKLTRNTRTDPAAIRDDLHRIREQGYCASFGEMLSDTAAIAVPVHGMNSDNLGAIMLAAPLDRMKLSFDRYLAATLEAGRRASVGS